MVMSLSVVAALGVGSAFYAVDRLARSSRKKGYRRKKAKLQNALLRNDFKQRFLVPELSASFGPENEKDTDISDHLSDLFFDVMNAEPKLIVELGTRGGESTKVLLAAAHHLDARVLSIDINECSNIDVVPEQAKRWTFIQADDVAFGKERFVDWCETEGLPKHADLIFLDTSHLYDHTVQELAAWMPHLRPGGVLILHDTNMRAWMYRRLDGSVGVGDYNDRGVIRALEEYLGTQYDENAVFCDLRKDFLIRHRPNCNGYTVLKRRTQPVSP